MEETLLEEEPRRLFGYNLIDAYMVVLCIVMGILLIGFFIWFGIEHAK